MGDIINLTAGDGATFRAYEARPQGTPKAGVVVIQEVWGINRWVRSIADDYAREGYLAVAPAMFDRIEHGYESEDYSQASLGTIRRLREALSIEDALKDVEAAVGRAARAGKVGITGFCFGGMISWRAAHAGLGLSAASGYYGGGVQSYIDLAPQIPTEMHFGDRDTGIPLEQIEALRARYPEVPVHLYDAGHGFANSDTERYVEPAAKLAWSRTLEFFAKHLA